MSLKYKIIRKKVSERFGGASKYYPIPEYDGTVNIRGLAKRISMISTHSSADTLGAVEALTTIITELVQEGKIVKIEELGSFKITFKTEGDIVPSNITKNNIKEYRMVFTPAKNLKKQIKTTMVEKV